MKWVTPGWTKPSSSRVNYLSQSVLLDFSLTVKVATLIFISGCGSAISSAEEGKSGFILIWLRVNKLFEPRIRACIK